jgi:hypothetical protein
MGYEADCTVRVGQRASAGKALLEGEALLFRGDFRIEIPFERVREIAVVGDALVVTSDEEARFELGAQVAERWMKLIRRPKTLFEKLELGPESRVAVVDVNDPAFLARVRERAASLAEGRVPEGAPIVFFGAESREALRKVPLLRARMGDAGVLWIVRPKGANTISEAHVLESARGTGLVDTKVVAFSKTHTAHKFVVPVELRGKARRRPPILTIPPSAPVLGRATGAEGGRVLSPKASSEGSGRRASARPPAQKAPTKPKKGR